MSEELPEVPEARVEGVRTRRLPWLLPLGALVFALYLAFEAWLGSGPLITIHARAGHGIGVGDPLRFRGVNVGQVEDVYLTRDLDRVALDVRLDPQAAGLCREGSRFWIVRPRMGLDSVQGLETIVGARYLSVDPGDLDGPARYEFEALADPPVAELVEEAGLELRLESSGPVRLSRGAQLTHRGIVVGTVLDLGLATDGSRVEIDAYVRPEYRDLVRSNTSFWSTGGLEVNMALAKGLSIEVDSLRSLVVGGIALATPTEAGAPALDGDLFRLREGPPGDLEEWQPLLHLGRDVGPEPEPPQAVQASSLSWESGGLLSRESRVQGWVVRLPRGLLGPRELLVLPEDAEVEGSRLVVGSAQMSLDSELLWEGEGLVLRAVSGPGAPSLEVQQVRFAPRLQDTLVQAHPELEPWPLSRSRLQPSAQGWRLSEELEPDANWNGALVYGLEDERYIGVLLVAEEGSRVALFQAELW